MHSSNRILAVRCHFANSNPNYLSTMSNELEALCCLSFSRTENFPGFKFPVLEKVGVEEAVLDNIDRPRCERQRWRTQQFGFKLLLGDTKNPICLVSWSHFPNLSLRPWRMKLFSSVMDFWVRFSRIMISSFAPEGTMMCTVQFSVRTHFTSASEFEIWTLRPVKIYRASTASTIGELYSFIFRLQLSRQARCRHPLPQPIFGICFRTFLVNEILLLVILLPEIDKRNHWQKSFIGYSNLALL